MSRSRKALITAGFSYAQTAIGIALAVVVTRFLVQRLGDSLYSLWLASGALLAYAALADLGIFGVLPWLIAEADGKKDRPAMRALVAHGCAVGVLVGTAYVLVALVLWTVFPSVLHATAADRAQLFGPLALMVAATFLSYPLRVFVALLAGVQDVFFSGFISLGQLVLSNALIVTLTWRGYGLYGVASGAAIPPLLIGAAALVRTLIKQRDVLRDWPRLEWRIARPILSGGMGAWMGSMGWQLAFSSDAIVIGYVGKRELITVFAFTSRIGQMLMQLGWSLPDSALVGLAQLNAEGLKDRVRQVVMAILRFNSLTAGGVACIVLAVNPGFVRIWVGEARFGGLTLNALFAADIIMLSIVHGMMTTLSVLGNRPKVGAITFTNGALHALLALPLGAVWGLSGVAAATFLSALVTTFPMGLRWLHAFAGISPRVFFRDLLAPWAVRALPVIAVAGVVGRLARHQSLPALAVAGAFVSVAYAVASRSILRDMPFGPRARRLLVSMRLV
jgi:O-antigen/teichoic acid export membrane protein